MLVMKRILALLVVLFFLFIPLSAYPQVRIEPNALIDSNFSRGAVEQGVQIIRLYGYACNSVSSLSVGWKGNVEIKCNNYKYTYEIVDRGGRWTVCIDKCKF